jgi:hypothetical protein
MVYMPTPEWMGKPCDPLPDDEMVLATHLDWLTTSETEIDVWLHELWGDAQFNKTEKQYFAALSGKLALLVASSESADNQYERWLSIKNPLCQPDLAERAKEWVVHIVGMTCGIEKNNNQQDALKLHRLEQLEQHPEWVVHTNAMT